MVKVELSCSRVLFSWSGWSCDNFLCVELENELRSQIQLDFVTESDKSDKSLFLVRGSRADNIMEAEASRSSLRMLDWCTDFIFLVLLFTILSISGGAAKQLFSTSIICPSKNWHSVWSWSCCTWPTGSVFQTLRWLLNWQEIEGTKFVPIFSGLQCKWH